MVRYIPIALLTLALAAPASAQWADPGGTWTGTTAAPPDVAAVETQPDQQQEPDTPAVVTDAPAVVVTTAPAATVVAPAIVPCDGLCLLDAARALRPPVPPNPFDSLPAGAVLPSRPGIPDKPGVMPRPPVPHPVSIYTGQAV